MTALKMTFAGGENPRMDPILRGAVSPEGIELAAEQVHPADLFWRQFQDQEFDVSEMSLSSLLVAISRGVRDWVALPVFPRREFFHLRIMVREGAGIDRPEDLRGRRVGVPEYQQTAALWSRGVLQHEFGVADRDMEWFMERGSTGSHAEALAVRPPDGVTVHQIPGDDSMAAMFAEGRLDASLLFIEEPTLLDRSSMTRTGSPGIARPLFPNPHEEARRYFAKTGLWHINHCVVVRRSLAESHPWVITSLFDAFEAARAQAHARARSLLEALWHTGVISMVSPTLDMDPFAYGLAANRGVLETLAAYSAEQGLTDALVPMKAIFAPQFLGAHS